MAFGFSSKLLYGFVILFFLFIVFFPPVYILSYIFGGGFSLSSDSLGAVVNSFKIALTVVALDVLFALPLSWILARKKFRHRLLVDTLVDMPLVVPTSILGISVYMFWGGEWAASLFGPSVHLFSKGYWMIILLHVVFTFPYLVRSIQAGLLQVSRIHEEAARTLGASALTMYRTISLPLVKKSVISGCILAFTRSLSETGATMMVAGVVKTAPVIVVEYKNAGSVSDAAAVSIVLILAAAALLVIARFASIKTRVPLFHVYPGTEKFLSARFIGVRDAGVFFFVAGFILLPTAFIVLANIGVVNASAFTALIHNGLILKGVVISFFVAAIATIVNLVFAIPMGVIISKNKFRLGHVFDTLNDVILLVPTSALGLSLALFWGNFEVNDLLVLVLAHISFSFPFMVRPVSAALTGVNEELVEAARTLGATPYKSFKTITFPLIKPAIIAGVIMTFMRSLSETGATMSVSRNIKTITVVLVELFEGGQVGEEAILACILLFALSFIFLVMIKRSHGEE